MRILSNGPNSLSSNKLLQKDLFTLAQIITLLIELFVHPTLSQFSQFLTPNDFKLANKEEEVTFLTESDFENARKFKELLVASKEQRRILTQQPYYRGDIRGKAAWRRARHQRMRRLMSSPSNRRYNGVASVVKKWPNGRIPYVLNADYNERERAILARAFQEYHGRTCIRFVPKTPLDRDYLLIGKIDGCYSDVGRAGGRQELSLDNGCLHLDTVIHELMHSIGFYHEHERWDRDSYLLILWQNIDTDAYDQFGRVDLVESSYYEQPYDYHSIMHYDSLAFSKNGLKTLVAKEPEMTAVIGSAIDFSTTDLAKIQRMYQCVGIETNPDSPNLEFVGDNSIVGPIPPQRNVQGINHPFLPLIPMEARQMMFHPEEHQTIPIYLDKGRTIMRGAQVKESRKDQPNPTKSNCSDRTNLCAFWLPYCRSMSHQRIMRMLCPISCKFCSNSQKPIPIFAKENTHSFPVLVNTR